MGGPGRRARSTVVALAAVGAILIVPLHAHAGLADVVISTAPGADGEAVTRLDTFAYLASPFEANDLVVEVRPDAVVFREASLTVSAGAGCVADGPTGVRCPIPLAPLGQGIRRLIAVQGADEDDRITVTRTARSDVSFLLAGGAGADQLSTAGAVRSQPGALALAFLDGGAGADVLAGGPDTEQLAGGRGADRLLGGPGDDTLSGEDPRASLPPEPDSIDGGTGRDLLTYSGPAPVRVDLRDPDADGRPGEGDALARTEDVRGGAGENTLLGDDGPNTLTLPGSGRQRADGRGGADRLVALRDGARLQGGGGDDDLTGDPSPLCGPGDDVARPVRVLAPDCERIPVYGDEVAAALGPLRVRGARVAIRLRALRPLRGPASERLRVVALVRRGTRPGAGAVLARGSFALPRTALTRGSRAGYVRLTARGRRATRGGRRVAVNVTLSVAGQVTRHINRMRR